MAGFGNSPINLWRLSSLGKSSINSGLSNKPCLSTGGYAIPLGMALGAFKLIRGVYRKLWKFPGFFFYIPYLC